MRLECFDRLKSPFGARMCAQLENLCSRFCRLAVSRTAQVPHSFVCHAQSLLKCKSNLLCQLEHAYAQRVIQGDRAGLCNVRMLECRVIANVYRAWVAAIIGSLYGVCATDKGVESVCSKRLSVNED